MFAWPTTEASKTQTSTTSPKAFSIALRAASTAHRCNLTPLLCEAIAVLGKIINDLGEYEASRGLVEGVLPLVRPSPCSSIIRASAESAVDSGPTVQKDE